MIAKMAGYAFRRRSSSYGGQVGSDPPEFASLTGGFPARSLDRIETPLIP
jgi:hypothetical protein